jgi:hypothetical protein
MIPQTGSAGVSLPSPDDSATRGINRVNERNYSPPKKGRKGGVEKIKNRVDLFSAKTRWSTVCQVSCGAWARPQSKIIKEKGTRMREHLCVGGTVSTKPSWWAHDAQRIPLCRVCEDCKREKLSRYRPENSHGVRSERRERTD